MISDIARHAPSSGALRVASRADGRRVPVESSPRDARAVEPAESGCAARGPLPMTALAAQRAHPVVVGLVRTDRHGCSNGEFARAVAEAQETAIRAMADRHRWRLVTVVRLPLRTGEITDPIECLLAHVHDRGADAVAVSDRRYLTDLSGHDCLEVVCQKCFVATTSSEQLWPCTADMGPVSSRSWP